MPSGGVKLRTRKERGVAGSWRSRTLLRPSPNGEGAQSLLQHRGGVEGVPRRSRVWDAPSRQEQRRGLQAWLVWTFCCLFLPLVTGFGPPKLVDREIAPTARVSVGELRRWAEVRALPDVTTSHYLVYDLTAGQLLFGEGMDEAHPPASLTKLMTALLVLEQGDLDAQVTVLPEDIIGGASMGLRAGMQLTVGDLLWGLLVPSGNDAALALARHIAGDVATFVERMNRRAEELGLAQTHFANPHGLDAQRHVSSARDLLQLTVRLWAEPLFRTMVGTPRVTVAGRELRNTNEWLSTNPAAVGVKTGTTPAAGECLIVAVEREGRTLLVVILGSRDRYADAGRLLEATEAAFAWTVASAEELTVLNRVYAADGTARWLRPTGMPPVVLQMGPGVPTLTAFRQITRDALAGASTGAQVGQLDWFAGDEWVGMQTLVVR